MLIGFIVEFKVPRLISEQRLYRDTSQSLFLLSFFTAAKVQIKIRIMTKFKRIAAYHLANGSYYSDGHGTTTDVSRDSHAVATQRPREGRNFRVFS